MQDFKYFKKIISKNILFMMILVLLLVGVSERIVNLILEQLLEERVIFIRFQA